MVCLNLTDQEQNTTLGGEKAQALYEEVGYVIYGFLLPTVCAFGMVGNVLNLTILTRRKLQKSFRTLEQAANLCLISLAVSDLMFCVFAFPSMFLPKNDLYASKGILLMYRMYCTAIINVFIMISTWLTVAMSLERYLAICHPLRQDLYLTTRRIKIVIALTYVLSFIFNIPVLWRYEAREICPKVALHTVGGDLLDVGATSSPSLSDDDGVVGNGGSDVGSGGSSARISDVVDTVSTQLVNYTFGNVTEMLSANYSYLTEFGAVLDNDTSTVTTITSSLSSVTTTVDTVTATVSAITTTQAHSSVADTTSSPQSTPLVEVGQVWFRPIQVFLWGSSQLDTIYRILWAVVNNVLPLILLVYFNVCLCRKIYRSYKMRQKFKQDHHSRHENSSHVLTVTLVVIVLMFFLLVAPSEVVIHAALLTNTNNSYTYMSVEAVMNFMQSLNFSVNFILYCIISPYFRKTLRYLFCCGCYNIYQVSKQWKKEFETSLM